MEQKSSNNCIHSIGYHIIWCPKYRHCVLAGAVEVELKMILSQECANSGWTIHTVEIMPDHVHLFIQTDHTIAPVEIAHRLKSISAVYIFTKFPNLKKQKFWGSGLWSKGTYYATVGNISEASIRHYIENQKSRDSSHPTRG